MWRGGEIVKLRNSIDVKLLLIINGVLKLSDSYISLIVTTREKPVVVTWKNVKEVKIYWYHMASKHTKK